MAARIQVHAQGDDTRAAAAARWVALAREAVAARGAFHVALSGGSSPKALFALLRASPLREQVPWSAVHVYFGDERCVPADHPESNYRMTREALLDHVPLPPTQIHPVRVSFQTVRLDAHRYAQLLSSHLPTADRGAPQFDLVMLGLGPDGHTASLFPRTCILGERERPVAAAYVEKFRSWRVSITYPVIEAARHVMFLVTGEDKAEAVGWVFTGAPVPATRVASAEAVEWFLDRAAAAGLPSPQ